MKHIKAIPALLLCLLILASFAVNAFANTPIDKACAKVNYPSVGDTVELSELHTEEPAKYTAKITRVYYTDESGNEITANEGDTYKDGVRYTAQVTFTAQSGYYIVDGRTEYYINSKKAQSCDIPCTAQIMLTINGSSYQGDESEGKSIFQKIADFFSYIIFRIRYFFWSLFPKV